MNNLLEELKKLNLPKGKYAIFGSAPIAIRGIRESNDLDIIVANDLWERLLNQYSNGYRQDTYRVLKVGNIEIFDTWLELTNEIDEMIQSADIINNLPFVKLQFVLEWKKSMGREKDFKDIELINKYLNNQR